MNRDLRLEKVEILIQQKKYQEAEKFLSEILATDANNLHCHFLLSEVYIQQDNFDKAETIANYALGLAPDEPMGFYLKARIAMQQDKYAEAENHIYKAIELEPMDADYIAFSANIKVALKMYEEALETANHALSIDAENLLALNIRGIALVKLNRAEESALTIEGALREDPNNAYTHANYGWTLLEAGNHVKALDHFKESLKNEPNNEYAQSGMLEAIKASNVFYRAFLKYSFWMSNMSSKYQWGVVIGFYVSFKLINTISKNNPALQPYLVPILVVLALLAFSSWVMAPIGNLFLRFNKYGQLLLDAKEKLSSNLVATSLGIGLLGAGAYFISGSEPFLTIAVFGVLMMVPLSVLFTPSKVKHGLLIYTAVLALLGILSIVVAFSTQETFKLFSTLFLLGFFIFQWVANYLVID